MDRIVKTLAATLAPLTGAASEAKIRATRSVYDFLAFIYPLSSLLFHTNAHRAALRSSGLENGMTVLEVATGSGEFLRRIARVNVSGTNIGADLSPRMALKSQTAVNRDGLRAGCHSADVRDLPFHAGTFDHAFACFLFELLPDALVRDAVAEIARVLKSGGKLTVALISQRGPIFNAAYAFGGAILPSFLGRQVEHEFLAIVEDLGLRVGHREHVRQLWYPATIVVIQKP